MRCGAVEKNSLNKYACTYNRALVWLGLTIVLELDDGVKVNYGKFGDLLAEVKAIAWGSGES